MYNFVTTHSINQEFKKSKYYKTDLGRSISVKRDNRRVFELNDEDKFVKFYLEKYRTIIYNQGKIGKINFMVDHYIKGDVIIVFYNERDFIFQHNPTMLNSVGIDSYIGSFIEEIETKYIDEISGTSGIKITSDSDIGDADKVINNPGSATYEDIKKYYRKKISKE